MGYKEGQERWERIKKFLQEWGAADRETLEKLFFPSKARSQAVLTNLYKNKHLARYRAEQYIYYLPSFKGDILSSRARTAFHATKTDVSSWWKITYDKGVYVCIHTMEYKAVNLQPLFSEVDQPQPGNACFSVTCNIDDIPRFDSLKRAIKHFYKSKKQQGN